MKSHVSIPQAITNIIKDMESSHINEINANISTNPFFQQIPSSNFSLSKLLNSTDLSFFSTIITIINSNLLKCWNSFDISERQEYISSLFYTIYNFEKNVDDDQYLHNLIESICDFAFDEFPNDYVTISQLFSQDYSNTKVYVMTLKTFFFKVDFSSQLRKYVFINYSDHILNITKKFIQNSNTSNYLLSLLYTIVCWKSKIETSTEMNITFFNFFSSLINIISHLKLNHQQIRLKLNILHFVLVFLEKSADFLDEFSNNRCDYNIESSKFEILANDLNEIYNRILSIHYKLLVGKLQKSFLLFLHNRISTIEKGIPTIHSIPIFDDTLQLLFKVLALVDKKTYCQLVQPMLFNIQKIDIDSYIDFLRNMDQSTQLCLALASFEPYDEISKNIHNFIIETAHYIYNYRDISEPDYLCALLFGMSRISKFLPNNFLIDFLYFVFESISNKNDKVTEAATHALKYIAKYQSTNIQAVVLISDTISSHGPTYIQILKPKDARRVFKVCVEMINCGNFGQSYFRSLFQPIEEIMNQPHFPDEIIEKSRYVIYECRK